MSKTLLIESVSFQRNRRIILDKVSLECCTGEIIGLFGRNGCGKSTLLKILFGTLKSQNGVIKVNNATIKSNITEKIFALSHQDVFLPGSLTVRAIIPMYYSNADDQNKIFYAPGIHRLETIKIENLSLGEKRYLQFLLVINLPHSFILLDEPFSMVDPLYRESIKDKILEASKCNKCIILTDHYYKDVWEVATRSFLIQNGTLCSIQALSDLAKEGYIRG